MNTAGIDAAVDSAKRDLAWLAAIHIALRSHDPEVQRWSHALLVCPDLQLAINNYPPREAASARERGIGALRELCTYADQLSTDLVGSYLNKSAVVYADAILQTMLLRLDKESGLGSLDKQRSVASQIGAIKKKSLLSQLPKAGGPQFDALPYVKWALFVAELRHVIVHKMGEVDDRFRAHMGFKGSQLPPNCGNPHNLRLWEDDEGKRIWPDETTWSANYPLGGGACLDIEKVLIPSLVLCTRFAEAARMYFS